MSTVVSLLVFSLGVYHGICGTEPASCLLSFPQAVVYTVPAQQMNLQVAALQEGAKYCARAYTVLGKQHSSSTDTQCVFLTGTRTHTQ